LKRLRLLDVVLLATLVPLWLACFALHVREVAYGRLARVAVWVTDPQTADSYPVVRGFWGPQAESSGLAVGDQLVRLGQTDLRGVSPLDFLALLTKNPSLRCKFPSLSCGQVSPAIPSFVSIRFYRLGRKY
jgi:hypothetical protein